MCTFSLQQDNPKTPCNANMKFLYNRTDAHGGTEGEIRVTVGIYRLNKSSLRHTRTYYGILFRVFAHK